MQPTHLTLTLTLRPAGAAAWRSHKIAAGVEISSPGAWGRVWLPRTARRCWRLRQGLSRPARSVQRRPGRSAPRTLGARLRAGVPGFRRRSGREARAARALWAGRKRSARPGRGCPRSSAARDGPPVPREMNGPRSATARVRKPEARGEDRCGRLLGDPARGTASRFFFPIRPPARRPPRTAAGTGRPIAARSPQLLAVRPRNSPVVGL